MSFIPLSLIPSQDIWNAFKFYAIVSLAASNERPHTAATEQLNRLGVMTRASIYSTTLVVEEEQRQGWGAQSTTVENIDVLSEIKLFLLQHCNNIIELASVCSAMVIDVSMMMWYDRKAIFSAMNASWKLCFSKSCLSGRSGGVITTLQLATSMMVNWSGRHLSGNETNCEKLIIDFYARLHRGLMMILAVVNYQINIRFGCCSNIESPPRIIPPPDSIPIQTNSIKI